MCDKTRKISSKMCREVSSTGKIASIFRDSRSGNRSSRHIPSLPNMYEGAIQTVNENLRLLNDSDAKSALIWIIGEYSDRIDGAEAQLSKFLDNIKNEPVNVQLNILTYSVKTYLKCRTEELFIILDRVFQFYEKESDYPDLRDRGFIYWRLIDLDPNIASLIVLVEKQRIYEDVSNIEGSLLDKLIDNLGTLSSVYSKTPELFRKTEEEYEEHPYT